MIDRKNKNNHKYIDMNNYINYEQLQSISKSIQNGEIIIFPTETVYGIGADGFNEEAVRKIFIAKGRQPDNPLILHISDIEMLGKIAKNISDMEFKLMNAFWPGPFTIILPKTDLVPSIVTANLDTVAVRMPVNEIAQTIIRNCETPIAAPSANLSGKPSCTRFSDIDPELLKRVNYAIDGGDCQIGLESTVVRVINEIPHILRPGKITPEEIKSIAGDVIIDPHILGKMSNNQRVLSPGMKYKHYSPKAECILVYNDDDEKTRTKIVELTNQCLSESKKPLILCADHDLDYFKDQFRGTVNFICLGESLENISQNLFTNLRRVDEFQPDLAIIQGVNSQGLGLAIMNRLLRACQFRIYS